MAYDWIKMRVTLRKHPKVIAMADYLKKCPGWEEDALGLDCDEVPYEEGTYKPSQTASHATVTRVTVCALMEVWGHINEHINAGDEVPEMALHHIDHLCDLPCFGSAMKKVGWVEIRVNSLAFPGFREWNTPQDRTAMTGAERAKRFRERQRNGASRNVTKVTTEEKRREETRREENKKKEDTKTKDASASKSRVSKSSFKPPSLEELAAYVQSKGWTWDAAEMFDHYQANGWRVGRNPMKCWKSTASNWNRRQSEFTRNGKPQQEGPCQI